MVALSMRHKFIEQLIEAKYNRRREKQRRKKYVKKRLQQLLNPDPIYKWDFPGQNG